MLKLDQGMNHTGYGGGALMAKKKKKKNLIQLKQHAGAGADVRLVGLAYVTEKERKSSVEKQEKGDNGEPALAFSRKGSRCLRVVTSLRLRLPADFCSISSATDASFLLRAGMPSRRVVTVV